MTFLTSSGVAYVMRVDDVPSTTGYGEPLQRHFNFADGDRVVGVFSHDARHRTEQQETLIAADGDGPPPPYGLGVMSHGRVLRFALASHEEVSTRSGRRFARLNPGDSVLLVSPVEAGQNLALATRQGRAMLFDVEEIPVLKAAGKGVTGIKLRDGDEVVAAQCVLGSLQGPTVHTSFGRELVVRERKFGIGKRGGRGRVVLKRGTIDQWDRGPVLALGRTNDPPASDEEGDN